MGFVNSKIDASPALILRSARNVSPNTAAVCSSPMPRTARSDVAEVGSDAEPALDARDLLVKYASGRVATAASRSRS